MQRSLVFLGAAVLAATLGCGDDKGGGDAGGGGATGGRGGGGGGGAGMTGGAGMSGGAGGGGGGTAGMGGGAGGGGGAAGGGAGGVGGVGGGAGGAGAPGGAGGPGGMGGAGAGGSPIACDPAMQVPGTPALQAVAVVETGLEAPVLLQTPRGDRRSFIAEQTGRVQILRNGALAGTFLDIRDRVLHDGEQGLLGVAFHPRFTENGRFFVHYSERDNGNTQISEFRTRTGNPDEADPMNEISIFTAVQPYTNHNGGSIEFGPDGFLYIALGDGGSGGDPEERAQNPNEVLGKILRIDVDSPSGGNMYGIPPGNPMLGRPEILHLGVRNPWRISFDRLTGDLYIGDVGQDRIEEVDVAPAGSAGLNFGWDRMEGRSCFEPRTGCDMSGLTLPITQYTQAETGGCTVVGGYVYRGCRMPGHHGTYFYADFCTGMLRSLKLAGGMATDEQDLTNTIGANLGSPSSFGEDADGEIYIVDIQGRLLRLEPRP